MHEDKEQPMMVCNFCKFKTCAKHKLPWHEGFSCTEFDLSEGQLERIEAEEATAKLLAENTGVCPKCKQGVTKTAGCNHMMCKCGMAWCFGCRTDWENVIRLGGAAHSPWCEENPNRVPMSKSLREAHNMNMTKLVHGGDISEEARQAKATMQKRRAEAMRPQMLEAAEKRARLAQSHRLQHENIQIKKKKVNLQPPWEEGGTTRKSF